MTPTNEAGHGLPKLPQTEEFALRAMATNYGEGPHRWDSLDRDVCRRAADEIKILRERIVALSRGVPADMVLVPREPTPEMQRAYFDSIDKHLDAVAKSPFFGRRDNHLVAYRAMIAAAPAAAGAQGEEYAACCDTPAYCSSVRRCTRMDATPQPAAADGGVRERARELLAKAERGPQNDYGTVHRQIAHAAIEAALTQQHTAAAEHWHGLYRKECRLRQDDAARYGQQIVDLEAALSSHRQAGDVLCHRVRFQGDSVCAGGPVWRAGDIPASELAYWEAAGSHYWVERAYDCPPDPATLTRVHRLLGNWERQAQLHGVRTFTGNDHLIFANELRAALVEKGAGS